MESKFDFIDFIVLINFIVHINFIVLTDFIVFIDMIFAIPKLPKPSLVRLYYQFMPRTPPPPPSPYNQVLSSQTRGFQAS